MTKNEMPDEIWVELRHKGLPQGVIPARLGGETPDYYRAYVYRGDYDIINKQRQQLILEKSESISKDTIRSAIKYYRKMEHKHHSIDVEAAVTYSRIANVLIRLLSTEGE